MTGEVPDPDFGGGSIRQHNLLLRVTEVADVELLLVGRLRDEVLRSRLSKVVELDPPARPSPPKWARRARELRDAGLLRVPLEIRYTEPVRRALAPHLADTSAYDLVQVEHWWLAPLLPRTRTCPWAITLHNITSALLDLQESVSATRRTRWLLHRDAQAARTLERWIVGSFDVVITMSDTDAARMGGRALVVPNGVDPERFALAALPPEPWLLLSASFNYEPNIDGAVWFCREVFPMVRKEVPGATLSLVGREPDERVRKLAGLPGVRANFDVPSITPYLESSRVAVVPVRFGSGTRLKALEAMAAGRPLAGTSIGLEGLGLKNGESACIADDPADLAASIRRLCIDDGYVKSLVLAARHVVEDRFAWQGIADLYINEVVRRAPGG